jgi:hypothetical protein
MKLYFKGLAVCLTAMLILEPLSAAASTESDFQTEISSDSNLQAVASSDNGVQVVAASDSNLQTIVSTGSNVEVVADSSNDVQTVVSTPDDLTSSVSVEEVNDESDTEQDNSDNGNTSDWTELNTALSSIHTDVLIAWVKDNPERLSALYELNAETIAKLSEYLSVSENTLSSCMTGLKTQNDLIVEAIKNKTDSNNNNVFELISTGESDNAATDLGVNELAIEIFKIKVDYASSLLKAEIKSNYTNGTLSDEMNRLGEALGDEDKLEALAATFDVEPAVLGAILEDMGIKPIVTTSITITNFELDIPDGVNDTFTYTIFLYSTSASGYVSAITGTYGNTTFESKRLYYSTAYSYGLPYNGYYTYFGYTQVALSAGGSVKIPDLPNGCNYVILVSASENYYVKSIEATYGKIDNQIATVSVSGANGPNKVTCTNDYAPHSLRLSEEVMSNDPDSVNDEFTFKIYLYQHGSSENTPLFSGDSVKVNIRTDGVDGAEAPDLGATLTFTTTESISLTGLSIPGTYNVAEVTLKHGQSIVLEDLGSDYGCYIAQVPVCHYMLYTLKSRQVYTYSPIGYTGSYNNYYNYINECNVSSSVGFVNAQETISITKQVKNSDTTRKFVFNVYLLQYLPDTSTYMPMREGTFNLTYTNPTGDEPKTVDIKLRDDIVKNSTFTDSQTGQKYTVQMSVAQIEVAAGQTVTIEDLPTAICYYIEEVPVDNYELTAATASSSDAKIKDNYDIYNTLSLEDESFTFTNTYVEPDGNDLSISKTVTGDLGDTERSFEFNVTLNDENKRPLSNEDIQVLLPGETASTMYTTDNDGNIKVNLKHGDTVVLQNLLQGTSFTITETDADDYTTSFSVDGNSSQESANHSQSGSMTNGKDVAVSVTNDKKLIVPTGIKVEALPYVIILMFSGITLVIAISKKDVK